MSYRAHFLWSASDLSQGARHEAALMFPEKWA